MKYLLHLFVFLLFAFNLFAEATSAQEAFNEGISNKKYYITSKGDQLRYAHFKTPFEAKGSVVFVQGRGTFLEFYEVAIVPLLEQGLDVWMYDLSGQGGSSRLVSSERHDPETFWHMQHIDSFDQYVDDLDAFVENIVVPNQVNPSNKLLLMGYSTGGHVALRYLQTKSPSHPFQAAFLISPLLSINGPNSYLLTFVFWSASWFIDLESYIPNAGHVDPVLAMPFEGNPYTSDEEGFYQLKKLCLTNQPLMMGGISIGWIKAASDSLSILWSKKAIQAIQIPVLIATGGKDGVVNVSYNEEFVNRLKVGHHLYFQEGKHELFRETEEIKTLLWTELNKFF